VSSQSRATKAGVFMIGGHSPVNRRTVDEMLSFCAPNCKPSTRLDVRLDTSLELMFETAPANLGLGPAADTLRSRLRGPVGLDIGAVTPEGIALAIVSQIHAWLAERAVGDETVLCDSATVGHYCAPKSERAC
jgi:hypothetical protein